MIRTQLKKILPVYSVLQNCFIYSRVKASEILHGATTPVASMKNRIEAILFVWSEKSFLSFKLFLHGNEKNHEKNHAYLTSLQ